MEKKKNKSALSILHKRYINNDPERIESLAAERVNARVARLIYDLREKAGLSQVELAEIVGTTQSAISRLEDADYDGHSLSMLEKITDKLGQQLRIIALPQIPEAEKIHYSFQTFITNLRRRNKMSRAELAKKLEVGEDDISSLEQAVDYRPSPRLLHKLSQFYNIPEQKLYAFAGATNSIPPSLQREASKFAAQSDSFSKLSKEEQKLLDEFMKFLRSKS